MTLTGRPTTPPDLLRLPDLPGPGLLRAVAQAALLAVLPGGGQSTARRNAWAGMSAAAVRSREQAEAEAAIERASARRPRRGPGPRGLVPPLRATR